MDDQYPEDEEGENKRCSAAAGGVALAGGIGRLYGWPSNRIVRVSRASGGKDRHSKVLTSKGLRDRRMRLSVNTAIQFYDLQDRLGYDQPSKAVEWLLNAAAPSIAELPPMNTPFPDTPKQLSDEKRPTVAALAEVDMDDGGCGGDPSHYSQPRATKSETSNSETSKGSGLSLSRSESRMNARERAKERVAEKKKERESDSSDLGSRNPISHTTSFTELLSGGIDHGGTTASSPAGSVHQNPNNDRCTASESNFLLKSPRWSGSSSPMDYYTTGLLGLPASSGQIHLSSPLFPELQHFSFVSDNPVHVVNGAAGNSGGNNIGHSGNSDYNLNFTISPANSSGIAGFNRGTLQSNSSLPSLLPHIQRFPDGSPPGFFIGATTPVENYHQFLAGYDTRMQHCYGDAHLNNDGKHSSQKGKAKS